MKATQGKANPAQVNELLKKKLAANAPMRQRLPRFCSRLHGVAAFSQSALDRALLFFALFVLWVFPAIPLPS